MLKIAVVDDEPVLAERSAQLTHNTFTEIDHPHEISVFTSGDEILERCRTELYDLILLDIDMPQTTGFEIAKTIRSYNDYVAIIFVTSKEELVFDSFEFAPFSFIRKSRMDDTLPDTLRRFLEEYSKKNKGLELIINDENERTAEFKMRDIGLFCSVRHDIFIKLTNGDNHKLSSRQYTLDRLEKELEKYGFIRIHKSYLVSYSEIYQIDKQTVIMNDRSVLPISRRRYDEVKNRYKILMRSDTL